MHDGEGLGRARDRDVEQPQAGAIGGHELRGLDDHHVVELEALGLGRLEHRDRRVERLGRVGRRTDVGEPAMIAACSAAGAITASVPVRSSAARTCAAVSATRSSAAVVDEARLLAGAAHRTRRLDRRRRDREQAGRDLHDLGRRAVVDRERDEAGAVCCGRCASTSDHDASAPGRLA